MEVIVVVAKYNEDISWVDELKFPYIIYDKMKDIPNVGREAETYLRYIITHYTSLPDYIVFLQGKPFDHLHEPSVEYIHRKISEAIAEKKDKITFLNYVRNEDPDWNTRTGGAYKALFDSTLPAQLTFGPGAQYIVPKQCILHRPLEFYETIVSVTRNINNTSGSGYGNCLACPWTLERIWPYIFDMSIPHKQIQYNDLL